MTAFYKLIINSFLVSTTNNFIWFALTYWVYLETRSVISTSVVGGLYLVAVALSGFWFGSLVDHHRKKQIMAASSLTSIFMFMLGFLVYSLSPAGAFTTVSSPYLWVLMIVLLLGVISGNIYNIALPALVTVLVPADRRDKANGLLGTVGGLSFSVTSFASGLVLGNLGMGWVLTIAVVSTAVALSYLLVQNIPEKKIIHVSSETGGLQQGKVDIKGTLKVVLAIPGLLALIMFTTFNNFLGGVFMALMDAYGLSLVSVQVWGTLWAFLSFGFIFGGLYIAKKGLGENPLRNLFRINIILWIVCIFFTIQPSIVLLAIGSFIWLSLVPFVEATEQTIIQKVVPPERQGRVFGFAQSIEQAASPLTAFLIGPIAQIFFIPFMTTGAGVRLIGSWFGTGAGRGIALVFITAGSIGLVTTLLSMRSRSYKFLSRRYLEPEAK